MGNEFILCSYDGQHTLSPYYTLKLWDDRIRFITKEGHEVGTYYFNENRSNRLTYKKWGVDSAEYFAKDCNLLDAIKFMNGRYETHFKPKED